jgi:hypothetical protein
MDWPRLLAYITGTVDQELLLRNEYLVAENRILKAQIKASPDFSPTGRSQAASKRLSNSEKLTWTRKELQPDEDRV